MVTAPDIPGHRVGGVLGAGGFATVYRCWQLAVGREVAVKVGNRALLTERDRRRFIREVTAAGRLSGHPHVIDVYDAGTLQDGRPFLVMELCPAGSLNDALRRDGSMTAAQVRDVWETFAVAILPADVQTFDQPTVAADPTVRRVCSEAVLLASRQGPARRLPAPAWDIQVLPPSEAAYDSGSRVYRCLANEIGHEPGTSQFRR